jgi:nitrate reductase NapD
MNISSIIVHARPEDSADLQSRLNDLPGVDIHAVQDDGRMVITIEDTPETAPSDTLMQVQLLPGVLGAAMIYNYCDE